MIKAHRNYKQKLNDFNASQNFEQTHAEKSNGYQEQNAFDQSQIKKSLDESPNESPLGNKWPTSKLD